MKTKIVKRVYVPGDIINIKSCGNKYDGYKPKILLFKIKFINEKKEFVGEYV